MHVQMTPPVLIDDLLRLGDEELAQVLWAVAESRGGLDALLELYDSAVEAMAQHGEDD